MSQELENDLSAYQIIQKKRDGLELSFEEIKFFINGLLKGDIADYQMSALLMAIYLQGMTKSETAALTDVMLYSGTVLKFADNNIIDKHSTGGVGDKTSFILAPIAASCGVKVPMIAGRGLGHTGGTVDKVESIKGFKTDVSLEQFQKQLLEKDLVLIGQTKDIAPADKVIYALRDVTGTVESIPLITASIMSKKLAEGANGIVMDIKTGNGAFMSKKSQAKALAKSLMDTAHRFDKSMVAMITDMNQPLGCMIGNSHEIIECIETLKGRGPKDLTELSVQLAGAMIYLAGAAKTLQAGVNKAKKSIQDGSALKKFKELIVLQGGDSKVIDDYSRLPQATEAFEVKSHQTGFIKSMNCKEFGLHLVSLGGGRRKVSDHIDFGVGIELHKKVGDKVKQGETLCTLYHNQGHKELVLEIADKISKVDYKYSKTKPKINPLIFETMEKLAR